VIFRDAPVYFSFASDFENIVENECENRLKPDVLCYGTCVLIDQLSEQSSQEELPDNAPNSQNKYEVSWDHISTNQEFIFANIIEMALTNFDLYSFSIISSGAEVNIQPPISLG
jgi:hypothetical protein